VRTSAGVKVLHVLCHALNMKGEHAFILSAKLNYNYLTPLLTYDIIKYHFYKNLTPIVVYAETLRGNPLNALCVVRYIENFIGLLGGDADFPPSDLRVSYGKGTQPDNLSETVLYIPVSDLSVFYSDPQPVTRKGSCFYADKYKNFHKQPLLPVTEHSIEITRDRPDSPSPQEIAALFRRSELFFCYENSALILEALLCGCPAVLLFNKYFTGLIGMEELGRNGMACGTDENEIKRAKETVHLVEKHYKEKVIPQFEAQLENFIQITQQHARSIAYETIITYLDPYETSSLDLKKNPLGKIYKATISFRYMVRKYGIFYTTTFFIKKLFYFGFRGFMQEVKQCYQEATTAREISPKTKP
jgi:hypothetical protein